MFTSFSHLHHHYDQCDLISAFIDILDFKTTSLYTFPNKIYVLPDSKAPSSYIQIWNNNKFGAFRAILDNLKRTKKKAKGHLYQRQIILIFVSTIQTDKVASSLSFQDFSSILLTSWELSHLVNISNYNIL